MGRTKAVTGVAWGLSILLAAPGPMPAQAPGPKDPASSRPSEPKRAEQTPAQAVGRLVEQLKRHPVPPRDAPDRLALYLLDLADGRITLIADQPAPGLTQCGFPTWSHDGRRIAFGATPGTEWGLTRLKVIEAGEQGRPTVKDLGPGHCPTFSPTDDRIAFLSETEEDAVGVWLMKADGSDRRLLDNYAIPKWSPDGSQIMILGFGDPRPVGFIDMETREAVGFNFPGGQVHSVPSWAGPGTIVAAVASDEGDCLALVDASDPARGNVTEVLWRKADGLDIRESYPIYSPVTRRCVFVGAWPRGMALYSVERGQAGPARRVGPEGFAPKISGLAFSPDGRYVLHSRHGPDRPAGGRAAGVRAVFGEGAATTKPVSRDR